VPSPDKRQRKKENARAAREAREAEAKKRRRNRTIRNAVIAVAVFVVAVVVINLVTKKDNKKSVAVNPTTTSIGTPTTTSTGSQATVPAAALAAVKCTDTKPPTTAKNQNQKAPAQTIDPAKTYTAVISTSCGDITVALDAKNAPKGVNNFVFLAKQGFYDGLTWHRASTNFVIQGGDPKGDGTGSPGYTDVAAELPKDGYPLGTLAYAKTGAAPAGAAGSQFFVVTGDRPPSLETKSNGSYQYGVFGHVTKGIEVAKKMEGFAPASGDGPPTQPIYIDRVTINES
jgi:cyclophilin family peptidyl-prolyl cis-trans isomerase